MKVLSGFNKPEYLFRPRQILRRFHREFIAAPESVQVTLPWGLTISINPRECIGSIIWRTGLYDLCVSECLWRLLEPGELAIDVGANIGHMTGLMALRTGPGGRIVAFEPLPEIFRALSHNVDSWRRSAPLAQIDLQQAAVSNQSGHMVMHLPRGFVTNHGTASLEDLGPDSVRAMSVTVTTLDQIIPVDTRVGVMKLDIEGHELAALEGARRLFENKSVRDMVFEEHRTPPTPVTQWLEHLGYTLFFLDQPLAGPRLIPLREGNRRTRVDAPNYVATVEPQRARERLRGYGWRVLATKPTLKPR
jgi:FkbM family methyltransferase